ncbi:MAG: hypothetical protein KDA68_14710 [Planctomycetaceae bacterium]|nr:hypothetical protein [Planctomycetaceae bacterium]
MIHSVRKVLTNLSESGKQCLIPSLLLAFGLSVGMPCPAVNAQEGLKGILPAELPERVDTALRSLTNNWQAWSDETANLLIKLYSEDPGDVAAQQEVLDQLDRRMNTIEKSLKAPEYAPIYDELIAVQGVLSRRVALFRAMLATTGSDEAALRGHLTNLVASLEGYEATGSRASANGVRQAFNGIRSSASDGGEAITLALRGSHLNYNARIAATEAFVHRMLAEDRVESGEVRDFILCADVFGNQVTCTSSGIDFQPQMDGIRFYVTLSGVVNSSTDGYSAKAVVHTEGNHTFWATKEVTFDGTRFFTQPAGINVNADNTPTKARTKFSGIPFLGGVADDTALQTAKSLEPESEAIAAERVSSRVLPKFNDEVDRKFNDASNNFQNRVIGPLTELNQYPDTIHNQTTETHLISASRLMAGGELGAGTPHPSLISAKGLTVLVHESMINNSIDRMGLEGKTMTAAELRTFLKDRFSKVFENDKKDEPTPVTADDSDLKQMVFAGEDPMRVRIENGKITLILRTGFKREGQDDVAAHAIQIPLKPVISGDEVRFEREDIAVGAIDDSNVTIRRGIQSKVEKEFKVPDPIQRKKLIEKENNKSVETTLTSIRAIDGWLALTFE